MPGSAGPYRGIRANNEQTPERAILAPFLLRRRAMWDGKGGQPLTFAKRMFPPTCVPHAGPGQTGPESGVRSLCGRWARRMHRCSVRVGESPMVSQPGGQVRGQPSRWLLALALGCGCLHRGCCAFDTMMGMSDDRDDSEVARLRRQVGLSLRALGSDLDALDEAVAARFRLHRAALRCLGVGGPGGAWPRAWLPARGGGGCACGGGGGGGGWVPWLPGRPPRPPQLLSRLAGID